jgi:GAF domain-containing protein
MLLATPVFEDEEKTRTAGLVNAFLLVVLGFAVFLPLAGILSGAKRSLPMFNLGAIALTVTTLSLMALLRRGRVQTASVALTLVIWLLFTLPIYAFEGLHDMAVTGYFLTIVMASLMLGGRSVFFFGLLSILALLGAFYAEVNGLINTSYTTLPSRIDLTIVLITLSATALLSYITVRHRAEGYKRARRSERALSANARELETSRDELQTQTYALQRRTRYLEATTAIAREAASVLEVQDLLNRVVRLVSEQFGFYHTGLFLIDPSGEWAELQTASSEGGQRMLARGHRLQIGQQGIVGYVTGRGEPRIALDVGADAIHFDNPDLPHTRSEMALPLRARGDIIGALDVQSTEAQAFSQEDVAVLQALADQVALSISNARLIEQAQKSLEAQRRAFGELSREAWQSLLQKRSDLGFLSDESGVSPAGDLWEPQMKTALQRGEVVPDAKDKKALAVPIKVRGHVIGVIDAHKPDGTSEWTPEESQLLETLTDQLGVALESTRLYQDTQRHAAQEQLIGHVTSRIRETLDMDTVLQTAVREIGEALGIAEVEVRMGEGRDVAPIEQEDAR